MYRISPPKFARYQLLVLIAGLIPLAWLVFDALMANLTANPIQAVEQRTGRYALYCWSRRWPARRFTSSQAGACRCAGAGRWGYTRSCTR